MTNESRLAKSEIRATYQKNRDIIPTYIRIQKSKTFAEKLQALSQHHSYILSFSSFSSEICTQNLNQKLSFERKLILPKINPDFSLKLFLVTNIKEQLIKNSRGILEPTPYLCTEVNPKIPTLAIIPGVCFSPSRQRIGYGKGCYDRLLKNMPNCETYGVGFLQQLYKGSFPDESHDVPLKHILLF